MDKFNWLDFQNGSDIRGIATEGILGEKVNLSPESVTKIAIAFIGWLSGKTSIPTNKLKVAVGRDSRISGPELMNAFMSGITSVGATAINCGLTSTPAMFMGTVFETTRFDGSAMLTASHLPFNRNGIKFFTISGGLDKPDITKILASAAQTIALPEEHGIIESFDLI